ncbi:hypothetical protein L0F63_001281 [Massospora cicadina]|nr:hypothetical protein L0F63_001281 [Massospora cicadina]
MRPSPNRQSPTELKVPLPSLEARIFQTSKSYSQKASRVFDLPPAPTFYPTEGEFEDPALYIASIRKEAEKYDLLSILSRALIAKPSSDEHFYSFFNCTFRFQPHKQKLNVIGAKNRPRLNFMENFKAHCQQTGAPNKALAPIFCNRKLDLYGLHCQVEQMGGYIAVSREKRWAEVGRNLGYESSEHANFSTNLRVLYEKHLKPFDNYIKCAPTAKPMGRKRKLAPINAEYDSDDCGVCLSSKSFETLLLCDSCEVGFHLYCLEPKLETIPEGDWFCPTCLKSREAKFEFERGEACTLCEFSAKADDFRQTYLTELLTRDGKKHLPLVSMSAEEVENLVEEEFWRLVDDPFNEVVAEGGVELEVNFHGSGFPTVERNPSDPHARHPWNLNNLSILPSSILSHLKCPISGMTVPALNVGQCFSSSCWHLENHYAYCVSYHHWGDTKTWYGIPANHAPIFEVAFRREAPQLFAKHPDLLANRITTLSPAALLTNGVHVYAVDQHPGEFVITFPRAYYANFDHGLNFNEAVNFAPADWVPHGLECLANYQKLRRPPVFSHHELLLRAANSTHDATLAAALLAPLEELKGLSLELRTRIFRFTQKSANAPHGEVIAQCDICHAFCFLMSVGCKCQENGLEKRARVTCLEHCPELCECDLSQRVYHEHVPVGEISRTIARLSKVVTPASNWVEKYASTLSTVFRPWLSELEALLSEAYGLNAEPPEEAAQLSKFIKSCQAWKVRADLLLKAFHTRTKEDLSQLPPPIELVAHIRNLVEQGERLGFQCDEQASVELLGEWTANFCSAVCVLLEDPNLTLEQAHYYQAQYSQLGLTLEEGEKIVSLVARLEWCASARELLREGDEDISRQAEELHARIPTPICSKVQELLDALNSRMSHQSTAKASPQLPEKVLPKLIPSIAVQQVPLDVNNSRPSGELQSLIDVAQNLLTLCESSDPLVRPLTSKPLGLLESAKEVHHLHPIFDQIQRKLNAIDPWIKDCIVKLTNQPQNGGFRRSLQARLAILMKQVQEHSHGQGNQGCICFSKPVKDGDNTITCGSCGVQYHTNCLPIIEPLPRAFICPICDVTVYRPICTDRIHFSEIYILVSSGKKLPFIPPELVQLIEISKCLGKISSQAIALSHAPSTTITSLKDQLRLLESLNIFMENETKVLRSRIARLPLPTLTPLIMEPIVSPPQSYTLASTNSASSGTRHSQSQESRGPALSSGDTFSIANLVAGSRSSASKAPICPASPATGPKAPIRPASPATGPKAPIRPASPATGPLRSHLVPILPAGAIQSRKVPILPRPIPQVYSYGQSLHYAQRTGFSTAYQFSGSGNNQFGSQNYTTHQSGAPVKNVEQMREVFYRDNQGQGQPMLYHTGHSIPHDLQTFQPRVTTYPNSPPGCIGHLARHTATPRHHFQIPHNAGLPTSTSSMPVYGGINTSHILSPAQASIQSAPTIIIHHNNSTSNLTLNDNDSGSHAGYP